MTGQLRAGFAEGDYDGRVDEVACSEVYRALPAALGARACEDLLNLRIDYEIWKVVGGEEGPARFSALDVAEFEDSLADSSEEDGLVAASAGCYGYSSGGLTSDHQVRL